MNPQDRQPAQAPAQPESATPSGSSNTIAIVGFILSFIFSLLGLIFSIIGLKKSKQLGGAGKGLAVAGIVISSLGILTSIAFVLLINSAVPAAQVSQRNDSRASDVNSIVAGINGYIATHNKLPDGWSDLADFIGPSELNHYQAADINPPGALNGSLPAPAGAGQFNLGVAGLIEDNPDSPGSYSFGTNAGSLGAAEPAAADKLVVLKQAGCSPSGSIVAGGLRQVAIAYRLEDQSQTSCLEI